MITADGRSVVEMEIEQMKFADLETRKPIFGLDYADLPVKRGAPQIEKASAFSFLTRWVERFLGLSQPAAH
jgi:hypothetical protein